MNTVPPYTALKLEIVASGLRQYVIAQRVGISEAQLSKILVGRKPLPDDLIEQIRGAIAQGVR